MFFARIASLISLAAFVAAAPCAREVEFEVEVELEVANVLDDLLEVTNSVLPDLRGLIGGVSEEKAVPLIQGLVNALNTASSSLGELEIEVEATVPGADVEVEVEASDEKRRANEEVADLLASVIIDVSNTLDALIGDLNEIPAVAELLKDLDPTLSTLIKTVDGLLPDIITLVGGLVATVAGVLSDVGLSGVVSILGL